MLNGCSLNVSLGGFGKTERTCVKMGSAKVLITVILPIYDNSLWIHEFNTDLTLDLCNWVKTFYTDQISCILRNDPIISGIKFNDSEYLANQYADDTSLTLEDLKFRGETVQPWGSIVLHIF
jgi:DNA repair photolyase